MAELQLLFAAYARDQQRLQEVIRENMRLRRQLEASTIALGYSENEGWWRDHTPADNQRMREENDKNVRRHRQRLLESAAAAPLGSSEDEAEREERQMAAECERQERIAEGADRLGQQYLQDGQQYLQDAKRRKVLWTMANLADNVLVAEVRRLTDELAEFQLLFAAYARDQQRLQEVIDENARLREGLTTANTTLQDINRLQSDKIERQARDIQIMRSELVKLDTAEHQLRRV